MNVVSPAQRVLLCVSAVAAFSTARGCVVVPRRTVVDPASVSSRNDAQWNVRSRPNVDCRHSTPDGGVPRL